MSKEALHLLQVFVNQIHPEARIIGCQLLSTCTTDLHPEDCGSMAGLYYYVCLRIVPWNDWSRHCYHNSWLLSTTDSAAEFDIVESNIRLAMLQEELGVNLKLDSKERQSSLTHASISFRSRWSSPSSAVRPCCGCRSGDIYPFFLRHFILSFSLVCPCGMFPTVPHDNKMRRTEDDTIGEILTKLDTGRHKVKYIYTPYVVHNWDKLQRDTTRV